MSSGEIGVTIPVDRFTSLSWNPSNDELAFSTEGIGKRGIYVIGLEGDVSSHSPSTIQVVQDNCPQGCRQVSWSPDGKYIAYEGPQLTQATVDRGFVWTMTPDGSEVTFRGIHDVTPKGLAWSADGRYLAIATVKDYIDAYLDVVDVRQATDQEGSSIFHLQSSLGGNGPFGPGFYSPTFAPMDDMLYFVATRVDTVDATEPFGTIYRAKFHAASDREDRIQAVSLSEQLAGFPSLSSDGNWLAYAVKVDTGTEIWIQTVDSEIQQRLVRGDFVNTQPAWRPPHK